MKVKVYFDSVDLSGRNTSGPHSFALRLAKQLSLMGITIADHTDYDIALVTIENSSRLNVKKPFVLRLDGIWFKPEEFLPKNTRIRECYNHADAVIFQSMFDACMVTKWFGYPKKSRVIHNGIELKHVDRIGDAILDLRNKYEKIFVCSASWHPQKRLSSNIEMYRMFKNSQVNNSCLIVMGGGDVNMDSNCVKDDIYYTGPQPQDVCLQVFAAADWLIHLAWLDHCPNVVLEALSQDTPVICTDSGGTHELLGNEGKNGIVIADSHYDFELVDYDNPPKIQMTDQYIDVSRKPSFDTSHLDIKDCAQKYLELFDELLVSTQSIDHGEK